LKNGGCRLSGGGSFSIVDHQSSIINPIEGNFVTHAASPEVMSDKNSRAGLWVLLALGALLLLAAALGADESGFTVKRTDRFNATLSPGSTLRIENVSGDISVAPGKEFSATVTVSAEASTRQKAEELLRATTIRQEREGNEVSLRSLWPHSKRDSSKSSRHAFTDYRYFDRRCEDCKISAQYEVTVPAGVRAILNTVNGEVRAGGCDGDLELQTVNGAVLVRGGRRGLVAGSVNGKVDVTMQNLPPSAELQARTVNGSVLLTLPKEAKFALSASTMNGTISSTFPLPAQREEAEAKESPRKTEPPGSDRGRVQKRIVVRRDGEDTMVDVETLRKEVEEALNQVDVEVRESMREYDRELRRIRIPFAHRAYEGSVGQGGGKIRISTLNGSIAVLAAGTRQSDAKPLVPESRGFAVTIPEIHVHARPVVPAVPRMLVLPPETEESVVRGDVSGDFLATSGGGTYTIGRVSGTVKILTRSGEIHVASAGAGADLKTWGGDIQIGPVAGDLKARTMAGDIQAGPVTGSVALETAGGDIRAEAAGGSASARTGGGDITLASVRGPVEATTSGGDVNVGIITREIKSGISIRDGGGDVTLTLPADFRGEIDLQVHGAGGDDTLIHSDFPEVSLTRQRNWQRASGVLNGGGPKIVVQTHSGSIRLRKGPAAR
jgi:DUF4097 and DUF4098 domain-containing protein YvlB